MGHKNAFCKLSTELRRHAISGPTPVSSNNPIAMGTFNAVKERTVHADLLTSESFRDDREQCAPQNREATSQQDQVIEEETRFTRENAFELRFALQVVQAAQDQIHGAGNADREERHGSNS